jgi:hypothetical protein
MTREKYEVYLRDTDDLEWSWFWSAESFADAEKKTLEMLNPKSKATITRIEKS